MGLFEVSMMCKTEFQELVCEDAGLWEAIHTFSDFHVDITINDFLCRPKFPMISLGMSCSGIFIHSYQSRGVSRYIFFMLAPPNLALGMLITLFHIILDETILALCVVSSYG